MKGFTSGIILISIALASLSCRPFYVAQTGSANIDTSGPTELDQAVVEIVEPYREQLAASMNEVLAELSNDLIKEQPESTLGNHVVDIMYEAAAADSDREVDFGITNYGGLRVPSVSKGPLKAEDAYQIMPFDNFIVIMDLKGSIIRQLLDQIAGYGGWPVHNLTFVIHDGAALDIEVNGAALEDDKVYTMATSDYLADGGDNLSLLKEYTYYNTGVLVRDAIMDHWRSMTARGLKVEVVKDGRVTQRK